MPAWRTDPRVMMPEDISEESNADATAAWRRCGVLLLACVVVGLPVNDAAIYALLALFTIVVFTGEVRSNRGAWLTAIAIVFVAVMGKAVLAPPRIDEGHNLFLPVGPTQALKRDLPKQVYAQLAAEFEEQYPPQHRCNPNENGCWLNQGFPDQVFAFSADGIFHNSGWSRSVTGVNFSDPVWLRLGFINELRYNWYSAISDVRRGYRDSRIWMGLRRLHVTMPWFEVIRVPNGYIGGELCWRGDLMWETSDEHFSLMRGDGCRTIEQADIGRRIVGLAIKPDSLAMRLSPPWSIVLLKAAQVALIVGALVALTLTLVLLRMRALAVPLAIGGLAILVIAAQDASFLGGELPLEGGDDGLFYDGTGRGLVRFLLDGDFRSFLMGYEAVYYYGGPGLRYFRAFEHILFGETFLGYLSLVLLMPFLVYALFRRFLWERWALVLGLIFIAVPLGKLFGTTFVDYVAWAERGYADPAAYILFFAGLVPLVGIKSSSGVETNCAFKSNGRFGPSLLGALLLALGIFVKPFIAPAGAVFLGGAAMAAVYWREWWRFVGVSIGILPVFLMPLHNWVFGHVFVLFSSNASHPLVLDTPPAVYVDAFRELFTLDFAHGQMRRVCLKMLEWLSSSPVNSAWIVPLNAAGVIMLLYVVTLGRRFDPWLRLIGGSALAQHAAVFFYVAIPRYHLLTWFLTMLVATGFVQEVGVDWFRFHFSVVFARLNDFLSWRPSLKKVEQKATDP